MPGPRIIITFLAGLVILAIGTIRTSERSESTGTTQNKSHWIGKPAPGLSQGEWLNAAPVSMEGLRGRVVLLEFWTYGCYNCRNTIPYLNDWWDRFAGPDFTIIGVHTPEFDREKDLEKIRKHVKDLGIEYPVVTDNDFETWKAYHQQYWPVVYIIDKKGIIRHVRIGEGGYDETEQMIVTLLGEH